MIVLILFPYVCAVIAILAGTGGFLVILSIIAAWKEDQALAQRQQGALLSPDHCVQEAERVLFRYQYRLAHGVDGQA